MTERALARLYDVAGPRGGYFTTRLAAEVGVSTRLFTHYASGGDIERVAHGVYLVGAPAVERSQSEHRLSQLERLGEVVVGAELEPDDLVVEPVGGGEHEDRHAAAGGDDPTRDLVTGRAGNVPGRARRCRRR